MTEQENFKVEFDNLMEVSGFSEEEKTKTVSFAEQILSDAQKGDRGLKARCLKFVEDNKDKMEPDVFTTLLKLVTVAAPDVGLTPASQTININTEALLENPAAAYLVSYLFTSNVKALNQKVAEDEKTDQKE